MSIVRGSSSTQRATAGLAGNEGMSHRAVGQTGTRAQAPYHLPIADDVALLRAFAGQLYGLGRHSRAEQVKSMAARLSELLNFIEGRSAFTVNPIFTVNDAARLLTWANYCPNLAPAVKRLASKFWYLATDGDELPAGLTAEGR